MWRSTHDVNLVAVLVHILGALDMVGTSAFQPAEAREIDHISAEDRFAMLVDAE